jgi:hypothetical protein
MTIYNVFEMNVFLLHPQNTFIAYHDSNIERKCVVLK